MKKSFVKLLLSGAMVLAGFAFTACNDVETEISGLESRVEALENSVKDLQAQITAGAVITDVTNTTGGVKVTLSNGKTFELTNGKDGANGANGTNGTNGKDGSVVTVGDNGNWFIDGVDTGLAVEGKNGVDGCYYVPNEETGCFDKVLADGTVEATEISWVNAGGVTAVWESNVLKVYGVEGVAEGECVEILLSSALKSLAYLPETLLDSRGVIDFTNLYVKDAAGKANAVFVTSAPAVAKYRVNPHNADVTNVEWSVLTRGVQTRATAVPTIKVDGVTAGSKGKQGYYDFALVAEGTLPAQCTAAEVAGTEQVLASLVATTPEGEVIVSDEAYAQQVTNDDYQIINHDAYYKTSGKTIIWYNHKKVEELQYADFQLVYNSEINIVDSLETYAFDVKKALPEINVEPTYVVTLPEKYLGADETTNQQKFVNLNEGVMTVNQEWLANGGRAAIGRTPIVKVYSVVNDVKLDSTYLKIEIVDVQAPVVPDKDAKTFIEKEGAYEYAHIGYELKDGELVAKTNEYETIAISWEEANADILDVLGLSYEQFVAKYDVHSFRTLPAELPAGINVVADGMEDKTATNFMYLTVDCAVKEDTTGTVKVIIPAVDPKVDAPVAVEFTYTVSHDHVWPAFNPDYLLAGETVSTVQVKGKKIDGTWSMTSFVKEHFKDYKYFEMDEHHNPIEFTLPLLDKDGVPTEDATKGTAQEGVELGMVNSELAIYLTEPLEVESKDYVVKMTETLCNGNKCVQYYEVRFVSPFTVSLKNVELKTLIADADAENLNAYLSVVDGDGKEIVTVDKNNNLVLTEAATTLYGLTAVPTVSYALVYAETGNDTEASFGNNLNIVGENVIWDNDGTDLQNNKVAEYAATVTFNNICSLTEKANVTVLSTANSKGDAVEYTTPNLAQWVYFESDYEANVVVDFGVSANGVIRSGMEMDGAWYEMWNLATYKVMPTSATAGVITSTQTVVDRRTGETTERTYTITYSNLTATTVDLLSYSDYDKNLEGLGIMKFDENWKPCAVTATKATTPIEFTEMGNDPGMEPLSK